MSPAEKRRQAVALSYEAGSRAPSVVAKGKGELAERIIASAREHGVAIHESRELVALLMQVDLDAHIPEALYRAVAELLAYLHRLDAGEAAAAPGPLSPPSAAPPGTSSR